MGIIAYLIYYYNMNSRSVNSVNSYSDFEMVLKRFKNLNGFEIIRYLPDCFDNIVYILIGVKFAY